MSLCTCVAGATSGWSLRVHRAVAAGQGGRASLLLSHGSVGSKGWAGTTVKLKTVNNEDIVTCVLQVLAFVPPACAEQFCCCANGWALDALDGLFFLNFFFSLL